MGEKMQKKKTKNNYTGMVILALLVLSVIFMNNIQWDGGKDVPIIGNTEELIPTSRLPSSSSIAISVLDDKTELYTCEVAEDCVKISFMYTTADSTYNEFEDAICCDKPNQNGLFENKKWCATQMECDKGLYKTEWSLEEK
jgi:hypothetical protein